MTTVKIWYGSARETEVHVVRTKSGAYLHLAYSQGKTFCGARPAQWIAFDRVPVGLPRERWCEQCGYPKVFREEEVSL